MADLIKVSQVVAQVEFSDPSVVKVSQVVAQIEFFSPNIETGSITVTVTPLGVPSPEYSLSGAITATVTPSSTVKTSFFELEATGGASFGGTDSSIVFFKPGVFSVIADGGYIASSDNTTLFLYEDRYSVTSTGGFTLNSTSTYENVPPNIFDVTTQPDYVAQDIIFGGADTEIEIGSSRYLLEATGGIEISSDLLAVEFSVPVAHEVEATGGFKIDGATAVTFSSDIKHYDIEATGGFSLSSGEDYEATTPEVYALTSRGGLALSGATTISIVTPDQYSLTSSGGLSLYGDTTVTWTQPSRRFDLTASGGFAVEGDSAAAFIHPYILRVIASGGLLLGSDSSIEEIEYEYHTWSIMGDEFSASLYSGWRFNSYAILQGQSYAAGEDGIYLIGDEYDAGEDIHAGLRIGPTNMGVHNPKRLRSVKVNDPDAIITVSNGVDDSSATHSDFKATMGREVQGDELTIDISDFKKISHIEIIPMILNRR